ncbi:MAG: NAD-dependent epimerase/dehydratase family protein [Candidatus Hodarchaeota archaeon]
MKTALILGAGGFIGSHLVKRLKREGFWIRGVDLKYPEFAETEVDEFIIGDLRDPTIVKEIMKVKDQKKAKSNSFDEVYQFAADMGGAGYVFTGDNDADIMHNSAMINLNVAEWAVKHGVKKLFYSSSACVYPEYNQMDPDNPKCSEDSAYPAAPDSEYGWEKLFSERLYLSFRKNAGLDVKIARFHNIFGPEGTWEGGKEKAPAALCRKVAEADNNGWIEVWGDGKQTRSFLYIDECLEGISRLMNSNFSGPVNIGSEEMISINSLANMIIEISGKNIKIKNIEGPLGVRGRNSDNNLLREKIKWEPTQPLKTGIEKTYIWIKKQIELKSKI